MSLSVSHPCAGKFRRLCSRADVVHDVSEFVKVGLDFVVVQEGRLGLGRLGEVGHHGADGRLAHAVGSEATGLHGEDGGVTELAVPGVQVQKEET